MRAHACVCVRVYLQAQYLSFAPVCVHEGYTSLGQRVAHQPHTHIFPRSCLMTSFPGADGKPVVRPYTPTTGPEVMGHFDLGVCV